MSEALEKDKEIGEEEEEYVFIKHGICCELLIVRIKN